MMNGEIYLILMICMYRYGICIISFLLTIGLLIFSLIYESKHDSDKMKSWFILKLFIAATLILMFFYGMSDWIYPN